jgi:hypothetical protein
MGGIQIIYPDTLPHPEVGQFTPRERRAINREFMRPISRDRAGTRSVAFTFTPAQAREFREWYQEWVTMGGGMFAAPWPMPWGRGPHVFRFVEPPSWQLVGGGLNGQGYWRVTADVELRGRGEMPTLEVFTVTSKPYPIEAFDALAPKLPIILDGLTFGVPIEELKAHHPSINSGILRDIYRSYEMQREELEAEHPKILSGELKTPLVSYAMERENVTADHPIIDEGELRTLLIRYQNWPEELLQPSHPIIESGTLT